MTADFHGAFRGRRPSSTVSTLRRAAGAFCAVALAGACSFEGSFGAGGGGCGGAIGVQGNAAFSFEQAPLQDLSAASGRSFAEGTYGRFRVEDLTGGGLGSFTVESSDPGVMTVQADTDADWPWRAKFHRAGTAQLRVRSALDGALLDSLELRVVRPDRLELTSGPALSPQIDGGGVRREPSRVVLARGGSCRLFARALDASGQVLFGSFSPTVRATGAGIGVVSEGMTGLAFLGDAVYAAVRLVATGAGEATLRLEGPGGPSRELAVSVPDAAELASLRLVFWPDDLSVVEPGESAMVVAVGRDAAGDPAYGFAVDFSTGDESVAVVAPAADPDVSVVNFVAPGTARIFARLRNDPAVETSVTVTVASSAR